MNRADWLTALRSARFDAVFNPYADKCPIYDVAGAADIRFSALQSCLDSAIASGVDALWVARDLGYRGGRRTGLAMTDDVHLADHGKRWTIDLTRATIGAPVREATATVIWRVLERIDQRVFLWNVFPLHPHDAGNPMSNRCHAHDERDFGLTVLAGLVDLLRPQQIIAIGGEALRATQRLGHNPIPLRHPSYGGARIFAEQVRHLHVESRSGAQPTLI